MKFIVIIESESLGLRFPVRTVIELKANSKKEVKEKAKLEALKWKNRNGKIYRIYSINHRVWLTK